MVRLVFLQSKSSMQAFQRETYSARWPFPVNAGTDSTIIVPFIGDLVDAIYLRFTGTFPETVPISYGTTLIQFAELSFNSNVIERLYGETLFIMDDLMVPQGKRPGLNNLTGIDSTTPLNEYYLKLKFSIQIPLCALSDAPTLRVVFTTDATVDYLIDYVYLSEPEKKYFMTQPLQYLTQYFQVLDFTFTGDTLKLVTSFVNNVKELYWVIENVGADAYQYTDDIINLRLSLNGVEYLNVSGQYLKIIQPLQNHTKVATSNIYTYSFALEPEISQPTGEVNMTYLYNQQHLFTLKPSDSPRNIRVYALAYNIATIQNGTVSMKYTISPAGFKN